MTQMFTIEARPYFIFRGPPNQACFQTCIRTQPCPVLCQILATVIFKLLNSNWRNLFWTLPTIVLVWFMLRGDLGPMLCQPWRIHSRWFLGPDASRGTAALPCYSFVLNLDKLKCLVLAHFHSWYMYKEIFTERQDGWDWNRPLKVTRSNLLLV